MLDGRVKEKSNVHFPFHRVSWQSFRYSSPAASTPPSLAEMSVCRTLLRTPSRVKDICLAISSFSLFYLLLHPHPALSPPLLPFLSPKATTSSTTVRHLLFSIASSSKSYPSRKPYIRLWYSPLSTRAFIFIDAHPPTDPNSELDRTLPPIVVSSDTSRFPYTFPRGLRSAIRVARIAKEAVDLNESDVRWFVFGDDDTVFFTENLVRVLSNYDHDRWYYVGGSSESYEQNAQHSFGMAFGGGGFAISHGLAMVLAGVLDSCLMRYAHLYGSDARIFACLVELGVELTHEPGLHQVDIRGNIFGMLSAHPLSPLLSLHHLDTVEPIFPEMNGLQALEHLFKAVKVDPSRILQQTVCYDSLNVYTVSVSWGYAVQVFQGNHLLPDLLPLQRSFRSWRRTRNVSSSYYMFNTRDFPSEPCKRPVVYFLESVVPGTNAVYTYYKRFTPTVCLKGKSIHNLEFVRVSSKKPEYNDVQVPDGEANSSSMLRHLTIS